MKNLKMNALSMLILVMILSSVNVFAQREQREEGFRGQRARMDQRKHKGPMIPDLTEEQQEKMKKLRLDMQKNKLPITNQLGEKRARMRTLSTAENPNMKEINKLIDEMGELRTKIDKLKAAHHQEVRKLLTEEQRVVFDAHSTERLQKQKRSHHKMRRDMSGE